jgi:pyruvate/2-oxoglutarate dehydrogenase complex dihydrolipoamide dehydrogenase (E3) component
MAIDADVIVVGLGAGGEFVAGRLAEAGLGVVGIESALVGGECPYWGCVPSKMIIRAANTLAEARRVGKLAGYATVQPDWSIVARRIREKATDDWDDTVAVERFTGKGGRFVRGRATVTGSRTVVAGGQEFRASRGLVLATGTRPAVPPVDGLADTPTGPIMRLWRPRRHRLRSPSPAAARSAPNRPRRSPDSGPRSRSSRPRAGCCPARSRKPAS